MATCTKELIEKIKDPIKLGVPPLVACLRAGVTEAEFSEWMMRGLQAGRGEHLYKRFAEAVIASESEAESLLVARIRDAAGGGNWSAAAWLLERRWPERYTKQSVNEKEPKPSERGAADPFAAVDNVTPIRTAKK